MKTLLKNPATLAMIVLSSFAAIGIILLVVNFVTNGVHYAY